MIPCLPHLPPPGGAPGACTCYTTLTHTPAYRLRTAVMPFAPVFAHCHRIRTHRLRTLLRAASLLPATRTTIPRVLVCVTHAPSAPICRACGRTRLTFLPLYRCSPLPRCGMHLCPFPALRGRGALADYACVTPLRRAAGAGGTFALRRAATLLRAATPPHRAPRTRTRRCCAPRAAAPPIPTLPTTLPLSPTQLSPTGHTFA